MSGPLEVGQLVSQWIAKADHDLRAAQHTLDLTDDCPFEIVCFHAQQGAEKFLKALLVSEFIDPPRTHDLRILYQMLPPEFQPKVSVERLLALNRYAVESRYPGYYEPIDRQEAQKALDSARQIKSAVISRLQEKK